jgi:hypothetical protein
MTIRRSHETPRGGRLQGRLRPPSRQQAVVGRGVDVAEEGRQALLVLGDALRAVALQLGEGHGCCWLGGGGLLARRCASSKDGCSGRSGVQFQAALVEGEGTHALLGNRTTL